MGERSRPAGAAAETPGRPHRRHRGDRTGGRWRLRRCVDAARPRRGRNRVAGSDRDHLGHRHDHGGIDRDPHQFRDLVCRPAGHANQRGADVFLNVVDDARDQALVVVDPTRGEDLDHDHVLVDDPAQYHPDRDLDVHLSGWGDDHRPRQRVGDGHDNAVRPSLGTRRHVRDRDRTCRDLDRVSHRYRWPPQRQLERVRRRLLMTHHADTTPIGDPDGVR